MTSPLLLQKFYGNCEGVERKGILQIVENLRQKYTVTLILEVLDVLWATYDRWAKEDLGNKHPLKRLSLPFARKQNIGDMDKHLLQKE